MDSGSNGQLQLDEELIKLRHKRFIKKIDQRWAMVHNERNRLYEEEKRKSIRKSIQMQLDEQVIYGYYPVSHQSREKLMSRNQSAKVTPNKTHKPPNGYQNGKARFFFNQDADPGLDYANHQSTIHIQNQNNYKPQSYLLSNQDSQVLLHSPSSDKGHRMRSLEARLSQIIDVKIEKWKADKDRRQQILNRLERKLQQSEIKRKEKFEEEVLLKPKKNHLERLELVNKHNESIEERSQQQFIKEMQDLKDREVLQLELDNETRLYQFQKNQDQIKSKESYFKEKFKTEQRTLQTSSYIMEQIENKQKRSRQKFMDLLHQKTEQIKFKNSSIIDRNTVAKGFQEEREKETVEKYLKNAEKRSRALAQRQNQLYHSLIHTNHQSMYERQSQIKSSNNNNKSIEEWPYDSSLMQEIEERFKKVSDRKYLNEKQRERQVLIKRELEKLKHEEIQELKQIQEKQQQVIKKQIMEKEREKELQIKQIKEQIENRAKEAYRSQIRINKEKEIRLRQSLNLL